MENSVQPFCPHLGLKSDLTTSFSFPSKGNVCYHAKGRPTPELEYQRATCLSAMHINCPVYKSPPGVKLPDNIRQPRDIKKVKPKHILWFGLVILVISGLWLSLTYREQLFSQINQIIVPAWQQTQQALPSELPPSPTTVDFTPTHTQPVTPTATTTNTPEPTPSPTHTKVPVILALGIPIGSEIQFLMHRVVEGEAIGQFANRYNTTEAAIRAVNYDMPSVLFIDWILVIPLNIEDASELPAFQPIQIEEGGISVEAFARQLDVDIEDISYYNHVDPARILQPGEWILVPRE
jgi:hypothetical protein